MITIVDYGLGNLGSVLNMLRRLGARAQISGAKADILSASALLLPGVGHFDTGMKNLRARDLVGPLTERAVEQKAPVLGICLGMQLLTRGSEEGSEPGLGWVPATTKRFVFPEGEPLPLPHMGWNEIVPRDETLFDVRAERPRFYFVHSYHVVCDDPGDEAAGCDYGVRFTAALRHENLMGAQFHPEKSHRFGRDFLARFARNARAV